MTDTRWQMRGKFWDITDWHKKIMDTRIDVRWNIIDGRWVKRDEVGERCEMWGYR
jgi:hypothetical protein